MDPARLDVLLVTRSLAPTRSKAQELIRRGSVTVSGRIVTKPGLVVNGDSEITVTAASRFVSRGGEKLDGALDAFGVDVSGSVIVDIGASTGGFTDCVLQRGARKVFAVDVGHGQLDATLRADPRVESWEGKNARDLQSSDFDDPLDVVVVDASFIGLEKLVPAFARLLRHGGTLIALVKPQFEVGPKVARRTRGVVRDSAERDRAIARARDAISGGGFVVVAECDSPLAGPSGNVEHFIHARRT